MSTSLPLEHPYWHVRALAESCRDEVQSFQFSYYEYVPQSLSDLRAPFTLSSSELLDASRIADIIAATPGGKELAIHSAVSMRDGTEMHIPMVDMATGSLAQLEKLRPFLGESLFLAFKWFRSGRAFHGYAATLVSNRKWASLMGTLLLANQKGLSPTVDPRWIGHRLIAGYSALRWTRNTVHYIEVPRAVDSGSRRNTQEPHTAA